MPTLPPAAGEFYYLAEWIVRIAMLLVVPLRRPPAAATSWLLLIFFLPLPGLVLYLAIGRPRFPRWRKRRFEDLHPFLLDVARWLDAPPEAHTPSPFGSINRMETASRSPAPCALGTEARSVAALAERLGNFPATTGNRIELIDGYDVIIDHLVADIDSARSYVRILVYIFADDATGRKVIAALGRAAARGVACHVLIDPVGSRPWLRKTVAALRQANVEVRKALPARLLRGRTRRDMRNHRKLFLIDGTIGYAGSQNIVDKDFKPGVINRELAARLEGPSVTAMNAVFVADWYLETQRMLPVAPTAASAAGAERAQILPSGANYRLQGFQTLLTWQVGQADEEIIIVTPYLVPDVALLEALRTAIVRGVDVRIVVSAVADQWLVSLAQASYYDEILSCGVRIHRYRDHLLHAKTVCIDRHLGIIGSSNVDIRSFQLNEEVSLLMFSPKTIDELRAVQAGYLLQSDELSLHEWRARPFVHKLAENAARLVSPLL